MSVTEIEELVSSRWSSELVPPLARPGEHDAFGDLGLQISQVSVVTPVSVPTGTIEFDARLEILAEGVSNSGTPLVGETCHGAEVIGVGGPDFDTCPAETAVTVVIRRTCHCKLVNSALIETTVAWS